ncbi:transcriptional regulator, LysR family [Epibacterium ulvae]|uniref:Transcriptional regulator, LysR family n=1 Tax=Epibacterium ulvae TaxID=1156985 RepID=A0A1G5PJG9_9RHOB|nr:LysR family transcriptional regulator [Epibacterium ulvae]SCZ49250.1 transcriptional regulator, LysR family [Epibacterium ulvae]
MRRVSLTSLRAFERVAATASQKMAAEELGVTQTAVSHAIRTLEGQLGTDLFSRRNGGSTLTQAGRDLAFELTPSFARIDAAVASVFERSTTLTLSVTPAFAACWLAPRLAQTAAEGHMIPVQILATTETVSLSAKGADLAVRYAARSEGELLATEMFRAVTGRSVTCCSTGLPDLPLIETRWARGRGFAPNWQDWFALQGKAMPDAVQVLQLPDENLALQAALSGAGVALASDVLAAPLLQQGLLRIVQSDVAITGLSYWLLQDQARSRSRDIVKLCNWIRDGFCGEF